MTVTNQETKSETNTQKGIKAAIIFVSSLVLMGVIFLAASFIWNKTKPNNHNEPKFGVVNLRLAGWSSPSESLYVKWANEVLPEASRLGPTFRIVESGENVTVMRSEIAYTQAECTTKTVVFFSTDSSGRRTIQIDPVCVRGEFEFKAALLHELGHSIGMSHVCRTSDSNRNDCSTVGHGIAVMNPFLRYEGNETDPLSREIGSQPTIEFTDLDLREAQRVLVR